MADYTSNSRQLAAAARSAYREAAAFADTELSNYNNVFCTDIAALFRGRLLLVLGAGRLDTMAQQLGTRQVRTVSVNPNWDNTMYRDNLSGGRRVAAIAQQLPFPDRTFGGIVANYSVPLYLPAAAGHYRAAFHEVRRVLTDDGFAVMAPALVGYGRDGELLDDAITHEVSSGAWRVVAANYEPILVMARHAGVLAADPVAAYLASLDDIARNKADSTGV